MKSRDIALLGAAVLSVPTIGRAADPSRPGQFDGLQIATGSCMTTTDPARNTPAEPSTKGLVDEALKAVITEGANYIGKALTEAGKAKTWTASGARNLEAPARGLPLCVQVVRGSFDATGKATPAWTPAAPWPSDTAQELRKRGVVLAKAPAFLFEGQIIQSADLSSYTIRPATVTFTTPQGESAKERHIALFFAVTGPGTKATADSAPATNVVIGKVQVGTTFAYAAPPTGFSSPYEPIWFSLGQDQKKPITINAVLSETRDERAFLTFLGKILSNDKVKGEITSGAQQLFIPAVAQASAADQQVAMVTTQADLNKKMGTARVALQACSVASDADMSAAAEKAYGALAEYWKADIRGPAPKGDVDHTMLESVNSQRPAASVKAACATAYAQLSKP